MALINFSGIASGIDSSALIESLLGQQRAARIAPLESSLSKLKETNSAFAELRGLLDTLKSAADKFRQINGGAISKKAASSNELVATASATNAAASGSYSIDVQSLAKNGTLSFDDRYSSASAAINSSINNGAAAADRTVSITTGQGGEAETVNVELTSTTSLSDFVTQYNATATKSVASVVNVGTSGSPSYALVINSVNEGEEKGFISAPVLGSELAAGSGAFQTNTLTQAANAEFKVAGIAGTITRSSNSINDVIPGVSLSLQSLGQTTISVSNDSALTKTAVQDFVDAFNEVVEFVKENDLVSRESDRKDAENIFGPLASTSLDENVISGLRSALTAAGISGGTVNILADLGITTERDGTLKFDASAFETAIQNDATSVASILGNLGEDLARVDGRIAQFTRFGGLIDQSTATNSTQISNYQNRIDDIEKALDRQKEQLTAQFARLEALIGKMNSQQSSLASLLPQ